MCRTGVKIVGDAGFFGILRSGNAGRGMWSLLLAGCGKYRNLCLEAIIRINTVFSTGAGCRGGTNARINGGKRDSYIFNLQEILEKVELLVLFDQNINSMYTHKETNFASCEKQKALRGMDFN